MNPTLLAALLGAGSMAYLCWVLYILCCYKFVNRDDYDGYKAFITVRGGEKTDFMYRRIRDRWDELEAERREAEKALDTKAAAMLILAQDNDRLRRNKACNEAQLAYARTVLAQYKRRVAELELVVAHQDRLELIAHRDVEWGSCARTV